MVTSTARPEPPQRPTCVWQNGRYVSPLALLSVFASHLLTIKFKQIRQVLWWLLMQKSIYLVRTTILGSTSKSEMEQHPHAYAADRF